MANSYTQFVPGHVHLKNVGEIMAEQITEALGPSLPGNGSTLATHSARRELFSEAGWVIVDLCHRYYRDLDESVLPR